MQVDPVKPTLKAPESTLLKLNYGWTGFKVQFQIQFVPLQRGPREPVRVGRLQGRCLHSFPILLNLSSSVHRMTRLSS